MQFKTKPLVALTLITLAGVASAEDSVKMYGLLDINLSNYSAGDLSNGTGAAGNKLVLQDGVTNGLNGSRWGIKAQKDLNAGLTIGAQLEAGVNVDNGAAGQGGLAFGRQIFVSLAKEGAGELRIGRQYVLSDSVIGMGNPFGNALVTNPTTKVTDVKNALPYFLNPSRADNVLQYQTPSFSGLTAAIQAAPGETTSDDFYGVRAVYASGPLNIGGSYEWNKDRTTSNNTNKVVSLSANYNFGSFKLLGGLQNTTDFTTTAGNGTAGGYLNTVTGPSGAFAFTKLSGYTLGAEVPVGTADVVGVNYTLMTYESAAGATANVGKIAAAVRHDLGKDTYVYAGVSTAVGDLKDYISEKTVVQLGLRTAF
ncbi:hypothetical protein DIC66_08950 [Rhodoferax lacus]|uniref:Porin domain-containing protein n=1 Tax=Rhodoferax lacus TaxID=2184758 RepID=A0A3E1RDE6_9BURK|nr:porin [Rhodoferax lacus]RFO97251.1 hypothetical protein DIC66_08950 [Rhodoferax lacus]